jgi:hypothetical protein
VPIAVHDHVHDDVHDQDPPSDPWGLFCCSDSVVDSVNVDVNVVVDVDGRLIV